MGREVAGLLAPVPESHLTAGEEVCREQGKVAFGSRAWEVFRELENQDDHGLPVLIYASHSELRAGPTVTWIATYAGHVESRGGAHPDGDRYRPSSATGSGEDGAAFWAVFWEVNDLRRLPSDEHIPIRSLRDRRGRRYGRDFVPEGPILLGGLS